MSVSLNTHKLLGMAEIDDGVAPLLSNRAGNSYWAGFLIQDRATGAVSFKYRFHYSDGERSWYEMNFSSSDPKSIEDRIIGIKAFMLDWLRNKIPDVPDSIFTWHLVPPEYQEDAGRTMLWMEMNDVVHEPTFKRIEK